MRRKRPTGTKKFGTYPTGFVFAVAVAVVGDFGCGGGGAHLVHVVDVDRKRGKRSMLRQEHHDDQEQTRYRSR